ncbi:LysR family transcriptional regulator [Paracoccus suum]|uniref:LysR family transcriptional regulator n=1 Tax=Paracoccus suum TaxID=2259340 RepID=A0A344PMA2_9RHOB|nr:LysR family transcriptional regulator [Paracoccus suum]AXC50507.1 LysR family transcriptional regulator [Paracoccus suum]
MDTRQLKTLLAIVETGGFARAAEKVHLTPSAISQQVQALEQEIGAALFDRTSRPPRLTAAGQQMLETAREVLQLTETALDAISGRRLIGTLSLGSVRTSALSLLPRAIVALRDARPGLRVKLRVGLSDGLLLDVAAGRLDAAMVAEHLRLPPGLRWRPFLSEPLLVIAPPDYPLMTAEDYLRNCPFIRFGSNVPLAHIIDQELSRLDIRLNEVAEIDTIASITACVAGGLGVSIVPRVALLDSPAPLRAAPFGPPDLRRQIGLVHQPHSSRILLIDELHDRLVGLGSRSI